MTMADGTSSKAATRARHGATTRDGPKRSASPKPVVAGPAGADLHRNEVIVCGRLAAVAVVRSLAGGAEMVSWRLLVDRPGPGVRKSDVVDCATTAGRLRRQVTSWQEGDLIEVAGALHRRFWRGAAGLQSRCEVEVGSATRRGRASSSVAASVRRPRRTG
jgi:single-strand DNA-binding protein